MNAKEPGDERPKPSPATSSYRRRMWRIVREDVDQLRRTGRYQPIIEADPDRAADARLVFEDGSNVLLQVKHRAPETLVGRRPNVLYWLTLAATMFTVAMSALAAAPQYKAVIWASVIGALAAAVATSVLRRLAWIPRSDRIQMRSVLAGVSVWSLTGVATLLAGRRRRTLREEWAAHLAGESGHDTPTWQKVTDALGFVESTIRYRWSDTADAAWTLVDAVLKSRKLSNLFVIAPTAVAGYFVLRHDGTLGVIKVAGSIIAIGGLLYAIIRGGRKYRDVQPPEPKRRQARE